MTAVRRLRRRASRRLYRALFAGARALFPSHAPPGPQPPERVQRLLLVRYDAVGDLVVTTPALSYLRAALPAGAEVDVLASAGNASLLAGDARVHRVYVHDPSWRGWLRTVRTLRARRYDLVLSPIHLAHLREGLLAACVAPRRAARVSAWRPARYAGLFSHLVRLPRRVPQAVRLLALARAAVAAPPGVTGADPADALARWPMTLAHDPAADARAAARAAAIGRPFVAVNAWARDPRRALPPALAAGVVTALAERHPGLAFVLTPPPGAEAEAAAIADAARAALGAAGAARVFVEPASAALADLVALVRRAAAVVTPNTGNVHVAAAVGTPVVSVSSAELVEVPVWSPAGVPHREVHLPRGRPVAALDPGTVAAAFGALWAEVAAQR